jgi:hypothetical protein
MNVPTTFMVDTIGADAGRLPLHLPAYGGYVSGSGGVQWTQADFDRFAGSKVFKYYQGVGPTPPIHRFDIIDVESGAVTPQQAADIVRERVQGGIPWSTAYGTDSALAQVSADVRAMGAAVWNGHVNCILADWNLNEAEAAAKVGTFIHGMSCVGVQWASPSSNPQTFIPGTLLTLAEMNADLNVIDANWVPSGGFTPLPTPPAPPAPVVLNGVLVQVPSGHVQTVTSSDAGLNWH